VTEIVAAEELMATALALAQTLLLNSPHAMHAVKRSLAKHSRRRLDEELEDAIEENAQERSSEDFREGVKAFIERRRTEWPSMETKV
jgi:enoyl-CoA hydratase/carnithine racemase